MVNCAVLSRSGSRLHPRPKLCWGVLEIFMDAEDLAKGPIFPLNLVEYSYVTAGNSASTAAFAPIVVENHTH